MRNSFQNKKSGSCLHFQTISKRLKCKRSFDMPFSWIFAIIAGAVILLIAIYATTKFINTSQYTESSEAGKQLTVLLNPIVNGITSAYATQITLNKQTRIQTSCDLNFNALYFGREKISFSEQSGFLSRWTPFGANITVPNKYIFAENILEGKLIYIFSKPFYTGFRVDDLVYLSTDNYCFISAPAAVSDEVNSLGLKNVNISTTATSCPSKSLKVCFEFSAPDCNMSVYGTCMDASCSNQYEKGYVSKKGKQMNYFGSLLYAAIFSSSENYECNIKRLGKKISELAAVYKGKIGIVQAKDCNSIISPYLDQLITFSNNLGSASLENIYDTSKLMDSSNCDNSCKIYTPEKCL